MATPPLDVSLHTHNSPHSSHRRPRGLGRTGVRLLMFGAVISVPLALLPAYSGQASPSLTIAQAQAQITALQNQQDTAVENYDAGVIAAKAATLAAKSAQAQVNTANAKLTTMESSLAAFADAAYTTGGADGVDGLLAGGDPQTLISRAANLDEVARQSNDAIVAVTAERETLAAIQLTANDEAHAAAQAEAALATTRIKVENLIAQQQQVLSHLQANQRAQLAAQQAQAQQAAVTASRAAVAATASRSTFRAPVTPTTSIAVPPASGIAATVLAAAYSQMGKPYQWGAAGPNSYDCSGLVMWAFAHAGISLPHSAAAQYGYGTHVSESQFEPGDLVFYNTGGGIGHVGIYVGGGMMIDANHTGGWVGVRPLYSGLVGGTRL